MLKSNIAWLEGGGYGPEDIVGALDTSIQGPVWAGWHGFGWVIVDRDPATIGDGEEVDDCGVGATTWGSLKEHEDLKEALSDMKQYPSIAAFAADDQTIRWMCSYDDAERDGIQEELEREGLSEAAAKVQDVQF